MSKPSKSQVLYERNTELQKAYARITELEEILRPIELKDVKIAVLKCALGIKSLDEKALFERLEAFWLSAYNHGTDGPYFGDGPKFKGWAGRSGSAPSGGDGGG